MTFFHRSHFATFTLSQMRPIALISAVICVSAGAQRRESTSIILIIGYNCESKRILPNSNSSKIRMTWQRKDKVGLPPTSLSAQSDELLSNHLFSSGNQLRSRSSHSLDLTEQLDRCVGHHYSTGASLRAPCHSQSLLNKAQRIPGIPKVLVKIQNKQLFFTMQTDRAS